MKHLPFLPKDLSQLISFVPTRGWDAVQWRPLLGELKSLSVQLATGRGVRALGGSADALCRAVTLTPPGADARGIGSLNSRQRRAAGDALLRFFFAQWRNDAGLFLDLRPSRLAWARGRMHFTASGLHARLGEDFRRGMIALYRGFYLPDDRLFDRALRDMGFVKKGLGKSDVVKLRALLRQHFGTASTQQRFSIEEFRESFDALFDFFIEHDYRLPPDFVLVGFYLITLYLSLDEIGARHNVRDLCLEELGGA